MEARRGDQGMQRLAHGFRRRIAEDGFGGVIPVGDTSLVINFDDGVLGAFGDGAEFSFAFLKEGLGLDAFADVHQHPHHPGNPAFVVGVDAFAHNEVALFAVADFYLRFDLPITALGEQLAVDGHIGLRQILRKCFFSRQAHNRLPGPAQQLGESRVAAPDSNRRCPCRTWGWGNFR